MSIGLFDIVPAKHLSFRHGALQLHSVRKICRQTFVLKNSAHMQIVEITDAKPGVVDEWTISQPVPLDVLLN